MPPSRTAHSRQGSRQPLQPQFTPPNGVAGPEVIVLSSDDEENAARKPVAKRPPKARLRPKLRPAPAAVATEIVEIISEDDSSPKSTERDLRAQLEKAKREIVKLKKAAAVPERQGNSATHDAEVRRLTSEVESVEASKQRFFMSLEDQVCCEICTLKMWTPYTLPCGHTFCLGCLQDWFGTILAQHLNGNPGYNPQPRMYAQYRAMLRNPGFDGREREIIQQHLQTMIAQMQHPNYTCPSCRVPVKTKPAEAFAVKNIVRAMADAQGEASPKRKGAHNARREDPWDGFFPYPLT
ncbi:hypothetical protein PHLGIDRAFT_125257 [Phlebiopsis gigantea 11061_1 CR5-6]|uniref:RING-type domain-containing protein n=1 Tax=Phlebiopsis gigantea (strain 11061_1 CR5-6) TaxID=745531 RepID=A0A0C3SCI0_PHLG1|nr:hypothetical protein PHLGIDRAFT_125257 [Phlebiopsis gigantea 11061_1 CR5-6]